jgi:hypothetical protein
MKYLLVLLAVLGLFAGQAMAADGNVSNNTLAKMGLSMNTMSDDQGASVRGTGFGVILGASIAGVQTNGALAGSVNGYLGVDKGGHIKMSGSNQSYASSSVTTGVGFFAWTTTTSVVAGGSSSLRIR